jgi:hypothetical protein
MKNFAFIYLFCTMVAFADSLTSSVDSIDFSEKSGESHLILLENGRVLFINPSDNHWLKLFETHWRNRDLLTIKLNRKDQIISVTKINIRRFYFDVDTVLNFHQYEPSIVKTSSEATQIFRRMRRDYQNDSQCYNRAHVWAWEEFKKNGLKSTKHFLFFTRRYIRNYNYKWWFHVSPSIFVEEYSNDRIIDRRYTSGHRSIESWTKNFVFSRRICPIVTKYNDYRNNQDKEDCYLLPVPMFYWQPRDIESRDRTGFEKTKFFQNEVNYAYWEAF